jgi:hypothetical protein
MYQGMEKYRTIEWLDYLQLVVYNYNNTKYSTTKMKMVDFFHAASKTVQKIDSSLIETCKRKALDVVVENINKDNFVRIDLGKVYNFNISQEEMSKLRSTIVSEEIINKFKDF